MAHDQMTRPPAVLIDIQRRVFAELDRLVPPETQPPEAVHLAMRYTLLAPSKRVRAALVLLSAGACGDDTHALPAAASVELVHAASLIFDDLPAMDDTANRRGRPANHVQFGEATSILAAVGLLNLGFATVADAYEPSLARSLTRLLARTVGSEGLIGGQAKDLELRGRPTDLSTTELVQRKKTASLFVAAALAGALTACGCPEDIAALEQYGDSVGLAFQIVDDLLDAPTASREPAARARARALRDAAVAALARFGPRAEALRELAEFVANRTE